MPNPISTSFPSARLLAVAALVWLVACSNGIESDIRQRFAEKYDTELCVQFKTPFPATAHTSDWGETKTWLFALESAGLLSARELPVRGALPLGLSGRRFEFDLTDAGRQQMKPDRRFCYGRAEIVEVIDYTEPSNVNGAPTVQAQARLRRHIDADWARDPSLKELVASGDDTVEMLLVKKAKGGWSPAY